MIWLGGAPATAPLPNRRRMRARESGHRSGRFLSVAAEISATTRPRYVTWTTCPRRTSDKIPASPCCTSRIDAVFMLDIVSYMRTAAKPNQSMGRASSMMKFGMSSTTGYASLQARQ